MALDLRKNMDAVLFDFGGTLDSDGRTWIDRFYALYKEEGVDIAPRSRFDRAFYDADDGLAARFPLAGCSLERTVRLQVRCVLEALAPQAPSAAARITGRFLEDCRAHFRRNAPLLERLAGRYRLGVVSNFYGNLEAVLESEGLRRYFRAVVDSTAVGHVKPSPQIFRAALSALGCGAQDC